MIERKERTKKANSRFDFKIGRNLVKSKRSQEEMVGFVLIVIILALIALVLLAIFLRQKPDDTARESKEISNFLGSLMLYTTDCKISGIYQNTEDLIEACYNEEYCEEGRLACDELDMLLVDLLDKSLKPGASPISSHNLTIYYQERYTNSTSSLLKLGAGSCVGRKLGASSSIYKDNGNIYTRLQVCKE